MIVVEMTIQQLGRNVFNVDTDRRLERALLVTSLLPLFCYLLGWRSALPVMSFFTMFFPSLMFAVTFAELPRLKGIAKWLVFVSRALSLAGLLLTVAVFILVTNPPAMVPMGLTYLGVYLLVAALNLGYLAFRRVKRIP